VIRADGGVEEYAVITACEVNEGDVIRIHSGNGGGYGDPRRRRRERVLEDLRDGYVRDEVARTVYGFGGGSGGSAEGVGGVGAEDGDSLGGSAELA
jgi:N-methylhydantoinase B